jgi:membrane-anchored glycerophosphoryl diester phosphodiesterase (GDPDase)
MTYSTVEFFCQTIIDKVSLIKYILSIMSNEQDPTQEETQRPQPRYFVAISSPEAIMMFQSSNVKDVIKEQGPQPPEKRWGSVIRRRVVVVFSRGRRE